MHTKKNHKKLTVRWEGEGGPTLIETVSFELQDVFVFQIALCIFLSAFFQSVGEEHTIECMESLFAYNWTPIFL